MSRRINVSMDGKNTEIFLFAHVLKRHHQQKTSSKSNQVQVIAYHDTHMIEKPKINVKTQFQIT
jgi:hypothetical protein